MVAGDMAARVVVVAVEGALVGVDSIERGEGLEGLARVLQEHGAGLDFFAEDLATGRSGCHIDSGLLGAGLGDLRLLASCLS